ncbi:hypothetical protein [Photobacterium leiognathi]|uniref:hypothetical protein n=1 Tax=Photobacterium leiognathi TaxID=553611 RepID=UPI00298120C4|nr:hypothetical protein [Photobacterium leiognathi]
MELLIAAICAGLYLYYEIQLDKERVIGEITGILMTDDDAYLIIYNRGIDVISNNTSTFYNNPFAIKFFIREWPERITEK